MIKWFEIFPFLKCPEKWICDLITIQNQIWKLDHTNFCLAKYNLKFTLVFYTSKFYDRHIHYIESSDYSLFHIFKPFFYCIVL